MNHKALGWCLGFLFAACFVRGVLGLALWFFPAVHPGDEQLVDVVYSLFLLGSLYCLMTWYMSVGWKRGRPGA